jgi:hypothetical protein
MIEKEGGIVKGVPPKLTPRQNTKGDGILLSIRYRFLATEGRKPENKKD